MGQNFEAWFQRLSLLQQAFSRLGAQLYEAGKDLQERGILPGENFVEEILASRRDFAELRTEVTEFAHSLSASSLPAFVEPLTLKEVEVLLQAVIEIDKIAIIRQKAWPVLDRVLAIAHVNNLDFLPLQEQQAKARELQQAIEEPDDSASSFQALADGTHPFCALLTLIERREELDDEQWETLKEAVAEPLGKPLALAASRGKLIIPAEKNSLAVETFATPAASPVAEIDFQRSDAIAESLSASDIERAASLSETTALVEPMQTPGAAQPLAPPVAGDTTAPSPITAPLDQQETPEEIFEPVQKSTPVSEHLSLSPAPQHATLEKPLSPPKQILWPHDERLCYFSPQDSAAKIAGLILEAPPANRGEGLRDLIWRLLLDDNLGLAYHLARCLESLYPNLRPRLPAWLLHGVVLTRHLRHENGEIAQLLKDDFRQFDASCLPAEQFEWNNAVRFLLATAALRPTLVAPGTGAFEILRVLRFKDGLPQLFEYCQNIIGYGSNYQALDPNALKKIKGQTAWQDELETLQKEVEIWLEQATEKQAEYALATFVWTNWVSPKGLVHSLLSYIQQNGHPAVVDPAKLKAAQKEVVRLSDNGEFRREVNETHKKVVKRKDRYEEIKATALNQIRRHLQEALGFMRRWIDLQSSPPGQTSDFLQKRATTMRNEIWQRHPAVLEELRRFAQRHASLIAAGASTQCLKALEDLHILFDPEVPLPVDEADARHLLHADLLKTQLPMDRDWEPEVYEDELIIDAILNLLRSGDRDWKQAIRARQEIGDHEAISRIIQYLEANAAEPAVDFEALLKEQDKRLHEFRDGLQKDIEETRRQIEKATLLDLLHEAERNRLNSRVERIESSLREIYRFREKHEELASIRREIGEKLANEQKIFKRRFEKIGVTERHPAYARLARVLQQNDFRTANEYLEILKSGDPIPESKSEQNVFDNFFPAKIKTIQDSLADEKSALQNTRSQSEQAAATLRIWLDVKKSRGLIDQGDVIQILTYIGFNPQKIDINRVAGRTWIKVGTELIKERERCPVPAYGFNAKGQYRVLCVWDKPIEEDLLNYIGDTLYGAPVLVFYFGVLPEPMRRNLARLCRLRRRTFLVIDDVLLFHLCQEKGTRLPLLFNCALPLTFLEPYTTTAGLVPPEMFFGRKLERENIIDPMGSCFIYGGRQLGKTALLRYVEQEFHAPYEGRIALWLDLKVEGIGYDRAIDAIWELLAAEINKTEVIALRPHIGVDKILNDIQRWLTENTQRRILLLLDEADQFLESDSKDRFVRSARLKGLMEKTNRRFKVVFAGLHNVQRTTTQSNHPLAHYGQPLCIGPLLEKGEAQQALNLIEFPLQSIGYRLESSDLATRILSQTNYYPSLIQLYCQQLLEHISERHAATFDVKNGPPYVITSQQVEEVYHSKELANSIRHGLNLTLQLDQRYEVIAYAIAHECLLGDRQGLVEGFDLPWIQEQALTWWSDGFSESASDESMSALLDEMVGLGLLRMIGANRYTLRSPNVASLMGTPEQVEKQLGKNREKPPAYEAATFRSAYRVADNEDALQRSPLTAQQEAALRDRKHGTAIIFGCEAAGLSDLDKFAESAFGKEFVNFFHHLPTRMSFEQQLPGLSKRTQDGTNLAFVMPSCAWNIDWIEEAMQKTKGLKSTSSFLRFVFIANPQMAWQLVSEHSTQLHKLTSQGVVLLGLKPWHDAALRHWLEDCGFTPNDLQARKHIAEVTGNWSMLLQNVCKRADAKPQKWQRCLQEMKDSMQGTELAKELARALGLDCQTPYKVLCDLAILDEASDEDLLAIVDNTLQTMVTPSLRWAELLSLIMPTGNNRWRVNPLVKRIIEFAGG